MNRLVILNYWYTLEGGGKAARLHRVATYTNIDDFHQCTGSTDLSQLHKKLVGGCLIQFKEHAASPRNALC